MSEEVVVIENEVKEPATHVATTVNPFDDASWLDKPIDAPEVKEAKPTPVAKETNEEVVDELEYLKKQGYNSWDEIKALKAEAEELRTKVQTPAERKFANEESKKLAEAWEAGETDKVFDYLSTQRQLKKASELSAAEAIRLHIRELNKSNPNFKQEDVDDVFDERYALPKKPVQGENETADEFEERTTEYNTRVAKVNRAIERDAFTAKQELAKRITELVPPEIPKQQQQGPSPEALEARKAFVENYRKEVPQQIEAFKGFSTTFKDETVEIPISYGVSPEEMKEAKAELEAFADAGLDVNTLFSKDWVNADGTVNIRRMAEDRYLLKNRDKIFQKIANESGAKRLAHQIKLASNINVTGEKTTTQINKPDPKKAQADYIWENG